jgi:hypothetical protein
MLAAPEVELQQYKSELLFEVSLRCRMGRSDRTVLTTPAAEEREKNMIINDWGKRPGDTVVTYLNKYRLLDMIPHHDELYEKVKRLSDGDIEEIAARIEQYILEHNIIERFTQEYIREAEEEEVAPTTP